MDPTSRSEMTRPPASSNRATRGFARAALHLLLNLKSPPTPQVEGIWQPWRDRLISSSYTRSYIQRSRMTTASRPTRPQPSAERCDARSLLEPISTWAPAMVKYIGILILHRHPRRRRRPMTKSTNMSPRAPSPQRVNPWSAS